MRWLTSTAARWMPVLFILMTVLALLQFWMQYGPNSGSLGAYGRSVAIFLHKYSWFMLVASSISWFILFAGYFRERQYLVIESTNKRGWIMDILDRLTNRRILEEKLAAVPDPIVIDAEKLADALKSKVIGQDDVCDDIAAQIRRRLALQQRGKPIGVFLLAGPPGTGKTYLAKRLSAELHRPLLHFDMTQFSTGHGATQLFGMSKGYVGSDSYGNLTAGLRDAPDAVVLLDEFEKAHPDVHKKFLTAWNDGFVTEASDGRRIGTTGAIFCMTTNAATEALQALSVSYADNPDERRRTSTNALREAGFASEVLNRIDRIFVFRKLSGLDVARVTALEIEAMIQGYGLEVAEGGIDPDLLIDMMQRYGRQGDGASSRDLVRSIEESIADSLIAAKQNGHTRIFIGFTGSAVVARPAS